MARKPSIRRPLHCDNSRWHSGTNHPLLFWLQSACTLGVPNQSETCTDSPIIKYSTFFIGTRLDLLYTIAIATFLHRSALYSYLLLALPPGISISMLIVSVFMRFLVLPLQKTLTTTWHGLDTHILFPAGQHTRVSSR